MLRAFVFHASLFCPVAGHFQLTGSNQYCGPDFDGAKVGVPAASSSVERCTAACDALGFDVVNFYDSNHCNGRGSNCADKCYCFSQTTCATQYTSSDDGHIYVNIPCSTWQLTDSNRYCNGGSGFDREKIGVSAASGSPDTCVKSCAALGFDVANYYDQEHCNDYNSNCADKCYCFDEGNCASTGVSSADGQIYRNVEKSWDLIGSNQYCGPDFDGAKVGLSAASSSVEMCTAACDALGFDVVNFYGSNHCNGHGSNCADKCYCFSQTTCATQYTSSDDGHIYKNTPKRWQLTDSNRYCNGGSGFDREKVGVSAASGSPGTCMRSCAALGFDVISFYDSSHCTGYGSNCAEHCYCFYQGNCDSTGVSSADHGHIYRHTPSQEPSHKYGQFAIVVAQQPQAEVQSSFVPGVVGFAVGAAVVTFAVALKKKRASGELYTSLTEETA